MITADFTRKDGRLSAVSISGHAGFGEKGEDIVCASVTSAVQLTANTLTEVLSVPAEVTGLENMVRVILPEGCGEVPCRLLLGLQIHLGLLAEDYPGTIRLKVSEVF